LKWRNFTLAKLQTLFFAVLLCPALLMAAETENARIVTHKSNVVRCLAAVQINQIDGKNRQLPTLGFEIEPGEHTMSGLSTIDLRNCPPEETQSRNPVHIKPLDWFFEAGKVYYVALDYSSPKRENWQIVVWKAETEDGEVIFDITRQDPDPSKP